MLPSGNPLLMAEDGLAAGLELLTADRSQGITSAQHATCSAVTEAADAEMVLEWTFSSAA